jgi:hypothetical protein
MTDHDTAIPLYGGPFDGESMTTRDGRIPLSFPMPTPSDRRTHLYALKIEEGDNFVEIRYVYCGSVEFAGEAG